MSAIWRTDRILQNDRCRSRRGRRDKAGAPNREIPSKQVFAMQTILHVVSDRGRHVLPFEQSLVAAAEGGADVIQIREKKAPAADTYALALALRAAFAKLPQRPQLYVNDRIDIAIAADLDGVHLAARSLPIAAAVRLRDRAGWRGQIGVSVHSLEEAVEAASAGADYVTFGHVFASESHRGEAPRGLFALERVVKAVQVPVIAIGGIDATNVAPVLATGAKGVAVIGAVVAQSDPRAAAQRLKAAMARTASQ